MTLLHTAEVMTVKCVVFADSTVQSSATAEAERSSVNGSSWSSSHVITQFDFVEPLTEESASEITTSVPVTVLYISYCYYSSSRNPCMRLVEIVSCEKH